MADDTKARTIRRAFGNGAHLIEHEAKPGCPARFEIWLTGGSLVGSGKTFPSALVDGLSFLRPDLLTRASDISTIR